MSGISNIKSKRNLSAKLAARLVISAFLVFGTLVASTSAAERRDDHRGWDHRQDRDHSSWNSGYYRAPPVVYGSPYYAPPPVVYGPAVGITLSGVSIGIR